MKEFVRYIRIIRKNLLFFKGNKFLNQNDFHKKSAKWYGFKSETNKRIALDDKIEKIRRAEKSIYWIDLGINIGSEMNYPHLCFVLKEMVSTAIIIPLSSKKEEFSLYKANNDFIVDIGKIPNYLNDSDSYAMIEQLRVVSKKRLYMNKWENNGKPYKLDAKQEDLIYESVLELLPYGFIKNKFLKNN